MAQLYGYKMIGFSSAVDAVVAIAPTLDKPGEFIKWAEDICGLLATIYERDYDDVTTRVYDAVKEGQGYESDED